MSISVFFGKPFVFCRKKALRVRSTRYVPGRNALPAPLTSRRVKSVASTRTRPPLSAATVKPHSTDLANESSTAFRSSGLVLLDRNDWLGWTSNTRGPMRWKSTRRPVPPAPRSRPMSFEPRPAESPVE